MKMKWVVSIIVLLGQTFVKAQTGSVEDAIMKLQKGDHTGMRLDIYTNNATDHALAFIKSARVLEDRSKRLEVVSAAVSLMSQPAELSGRQDDRDVQTFVVEMVKLLKEDAWEAVRSEVARSLMRTVSTNVLDRHQAAIRLAADERKDIDTLQLYASLPSCDVPWLVGIVTKMKPETLLQQYQLDSIMARHGDQAATDRLIKGTTVLLETCFDVLTKYSDLLVFTRSIQVQKFLASELRSEALISLAGGDEIPWRNCCAGMLVKMNSSEKSFLVKKLTFSYSDDELIKIEKWCNKYLSISFQSQRKSIIYRPHIQVYPLRAKDVSGR